MDLKSTEAQASWGFESLALRHKYTHFGPGDEPGPGVYCGETEAVPLVGYPLALELTARSGTTRAGSPFARSTAAAVADRLPVAVVEHVQAQRRPRGLSGIRARLDYSHSQHPIRHHADGPR